MVQSWSSNGGPSDQQLKSTLLFLLFVFNDHRTCGMIMKIVTLMKSNEIASVDSPLL